MVSAEAEAAWAAGEVEERMPPSRRVEDRSSSAVRPSSRLPGRGQVREGERGG